jgi:hypothetical protein
MGRTRASRPDIDLDHKDTSKTLNFASDMVGASKAPLQGAEK